MTANYSNDSVYYGKNFKPNYIYADSVNGMAINMMREGMKTAKNKAFYIFRKDSVLYVNALGKKIVIKRDYASRNRKIEQIPSDSLVLTEKERVYINTEIDKMSGQAWKKDLLPNFTFITTDTLNQISAKRTLDSWKFFLGKRIYSFGVPIFLRNDTYCFFYSGYGCGGECGGGNFVIYKKVKGKWQSWLKLSGWMS